MDEEFKIYEKDRKFNCKLNNYITKSIENLVFFIFAKAYIYLELKSK